MIVITRYRVDEAGVAEFAGLARAAIAVMANRPGFRTADLGRNVDEPELLTLTTRWENVGSYRRALQGYEAKITVVPLLSRAIDEPTAYEDLEQWDIKLGDIELMAPEQGRGSGGTPIV